MMTTREKGEKPAYWRETVHSMKRRSPGKNYTEAGIYHITLNVSDRRKVSLGRIAGDLQYPDGHLEAPHVELTTIGRMVEAELLHSISAHYPAIEILDHVIMPEHMHFIMEVKYSLVNNKSGRLTHLGQVIAGFKKGCNRRYWEITGQEVAGTNERQRGKPAATTNPRSGTATMAETATAGVGMLCSVVSPQKEKVPSRANTGRIPLFSDGFVDVMPLEPGQLETQRAYIHANPRNRLLRGQHHAELRPQRLVVNTKVTPSALRGYLVREHALSDNDQEVWKMLCGRLVTTDGSVWCDGYGSTQLLERHLLPVVCHRSDLRLFDRQKQACLDAAAKGTVLVSARIARGEQDIMDEAIRQGFPVILIVDNGFPEIFHPSENRLDLCATQRMLLLSPWQFLYRTKEDNITVTWCKAMNCFAQAVCRVKDTWWKQDIC